MALKLKKKVLICGVVLLSFSSLMFYIQVRVCVCVCVRVCACMCACVFPFRQVRFRHTERERPVSEREVVVAVRGGVSNISPSK